MPAPLIGGVLPGGSEPAGAPIVGALVPGGAGGGVPTDTCGRVVVGEAEVVVPGFGAELSGAPTGMSHV